MSEDFFDKKKADAAELEIYAEHKRFVSLVGSLVASSNAGTAAIIANRDVMQALGRDTAMVDQIIEYRQADVADALSGVYPIPFSDKL